MELITERTYLIPVTLEMLESIENQTLNDDTSFDFYYNEEWPEEDLIEAIPVFKSLLRKNGVDGFNLWIIIQNKNRMIIGSLGFIGRPDENGIVEIGFGVIPSVYGKGICSEAVGALINWGLSQNEVKSIIAHCHIDNIASRRVVQKLGFGFVKEEKKLEQWKMTL